MKTTIVGGTKTAITENNHNFYAIENNINFSANKVVEEIGVDNGVSYGDNEECEIITATEVLIGKAERDPGYNYNGTKAEDMYYADEPERSSSIRDDRMFLLNNDTLKRYLNQLMESLSIGRMETVALEMADRFANGVGGTYKNDILDDTIANNPAFVSYHYNFLKEVKAALNAAAYDAANISEISMRLLNFSSFWDKVSGLGITIHQVWSVKAELKNYTYNSCSKMWSGHLVYTFYDHFGLDWDDIEKHGSDRIPQYHTGDCFKAWYILQHYRNAKPFITEFKRTVFIGGNANNP